MANLEVFVFVPDLRFCPGAKRRDKSKSGTKTKTSKFAMRQLCLLPNASLTNIVVARIVAPRTPGQDT